MAQTPEVTPELTRQVANLARLELSEAEVQTFTEQLGNILNYINLLQQVDVQGVEPMTQAVPIEMLFREDIPVESPKDSEGKPKVLQSAPEAMFGGYKVPPIL